MLQQVALNRADPIVVHVEHVEDLRDPIDRASAQSNPLLDTQVGSILLEREQRVSGCDRPSGRSRWLLAAPSAEISAPAARQPCSEEMKRAHLEAAADFPDR